MIYYNFADFWTGFAFLVKTVSFTYFHSSQIMDTMQEHGYRVIEKVDNR